MSISTPFNDTIMIETNVFCIQDKHPSHHQSSFVRALRSLLLALIFLFFTPLYAEADTHKVVLTFDGQMSDLGSVSYVTHGGFEQYSLEDILERHTHAELRGEKNTSRVIKIEDSTQHSWIVFTIENRTNSEDWILHFGRALDGRLGFATQVYLYNHNSKYEKVYNYEAPSSFPFYGAALPVTLKSGEDNLIVMRITAQPGFPLILSPQIKSSVMFTQSLLKGDLSMTIAMFIFILALSFFAASFYIGRNIASVALLTYYAILCAVFFNIDISMVGEGGISNSVMFALYIFGYVALVIATKFFNHITQNIQPRETSLLVAGAALIIISNLVYFFFFSNSGEPLAVLSGFVFLPMILCCLFSLAAHDKTVSVKLFFGLGMLLSPLPLLIMSLLAQDIIPITRWSVNLFWISHLIPAALFVIAYFRSSVNQKLRVMEWKRSKLHEEQSLARIKKSKESADQARLLRVIERERELMTELREREMMRTEEMRQAKDQANKANQAKSAFLAVVSHEIRTPMNGIMGMVQLLQNTQLSKTQSDYVDTIKRSGDTMVSLLNDILDFEKIERGSMDFEKVSFNLHSLANDVVMLMSGHASQKRISLKADIAKDVPEIVESDPTRLRQVLFNLVNNAIKFTDEGSVIISLSVLNGDETQGDLIRFKVTDTGVGIPKSLQAHLFDPFAQADASTARKYGGSGLGLTISYRLIEAMGGVIKVDSDEGQGSTFYFDLPLRQAERNVDGAIDETPPASENFKPMRILITEDNPLNRKVLEGLLMNDGHTLFMAANGFEALEICKREIPDIVLMDIKMDGMDGIETTKRLRALEDIKISSIPVIALTGNVMLHDIEHYFEIGMNGFVAKPVDAKNLKDILRNASIGNFENELPVDFFADKKNFDTPSQDEKTTSPLQGQKTGLEHIKHDFELDDREHFVAESELTDFNNKIDNPLLEYAVDLSLDDRNYDSSAAFAVSTTPAKTDSQASKTQPEIQIASLSGTPPDVSPLLNTQDVSYVKAYQTTERPARISPANKAQDDFMTSLANKADEELSEVQKYLLTQLVGDKSPSSGHSDDAPENKTSAPVEDSSQADTHVDNDVVRNEEGTTIAPDAVGQDSDVLLHQEMLDNLFKTLGEEQFRTLQIGFVDKAEALINDIDSALQAQDIAALAARAHDLKGMSGNFGMKEVSRISSDIERYAKLSATDDAVKLAKNLALTLRHTKTALKNWVSERS